MLRNNSFDLIQNLKQNQKQWFGRSIYYAQTNTMQELKLRKIDF